MVARWPWPIPNLSPTIDWTVEKPGENRGTTSSRLISTQSWQSRFFFVCFIFLVLVNTGQLENWDQYTKSCWTKNNKETDSLKTCLFWPAWASLVQFPTSRSKLSQGTNPHCMVIHSIFWNWHGRSWECEPSNLIIPYLRVGVNIGPTKCPKPGGVLLTTEHGQNMLPLGASS